MRTNIDIEHRPMRQAMRAADRGLREPPSRRDCGYSFRLTHRHRFVGYGLKFRWGGDLDKSRVAFVERDCEHR